MQNDRTRFYQLQHTRPQRNSTKQLRSVDLGTMLWAVPCLAVASNARTAGPPFCGTQVDGITTPGHIVATYLDLACSLPGATLTVDFASE